MQALRQFIHEVLVEIDRKERSQVIDLLSSFKDNNSPKTHAELLKAYKSGQYDDLLKPPTKGHAFRGMGPLTTKKLTAMLGKVPVSGFQRLTTQVSAGSSWTMDPEVAATYAAEASYGRGSDLSNTWSVVIIVDVASNLGSLFGNPKAIDKATGFATTLPERELLSTGKPLKTSGVVCVQNVDDYSTIFSSIMSALPKK